MAVKCKQRSEVYEAGLWLPLRLLAAATRKRWPVFANAGLDFVPGIHLA
jgi:hypothetical protein